MLCVDIHNFGGKVGVEGIFIVSNWRVWHLQCGRQHCDECEKSVLMVSLNSNKQMWKSRYNSIKNVYSMAYCRLIF